MQNTEAQRDDRIGILLANLGTPDSPSTRDVRRYLKQFLWDPRVVEVPRLAWWFVLNLVILNTRPRRSAKAYAKVWTEEGSPLLVISRQQQAALQAALMQRYDGQVTSALGMCYGNPSVASGLAQLRDAGCRRILVLPLYPQYSATSNAAVFDAVYKEMQGWRAVPELRFVNDYFDNDDYIGALADSVRRYQAEHGTPDRLLMSFHGIPQDYADKGDPYPCQCEVTAMLLAKELGLDATQWTYSYQSRLGPRDWLKPYTDKTLEALPGEGVKNLQVVCPGFSADCLETLEEIAMENRDVFMAAGGERYEYIPCLNAERAHIDMLVALAGRHLQGWLDA
ncbi:MAG TPA: ferrochelatase [Gammaproteobacteria bacterium]|jgi:ferrochelatase|nr:ferrochelatase [Gammaproteobacteria bacterium]